MMRRLLRSLWRDTAGTAVTEFALWVTFFFFGVLVALDFGDYYIDRGELSSALAVSSIAAFQARDNVNFANIQSDVRNMTQDQAVTVATGCNGGTNNCTNLNRTCACLKNDGTFVAANSCGASCSGSGVTAGSTSGYYLQIRASRPFSPMIIPHGTLAANSIQQTATVRLQ